MYFKNRKPNYDKYPALVIPTEEKQAWSGYDAIRKHIQEDLKQKGNDVVIVIDYYHGTRQQELLDYLIKPLSPEAIFHSDEAKIPEAELYKKLANFIREDRVFGSLSTHTLTDFFDKQRSETLTKNIKDTKGLRIVYGVGASLFAKGDIVLYADLTRWEIQLRYRSQELDNWGVGNFDEDILRKYKRGYFVEWRVLDRHKVQVLQQMDYILDTNVKAEPKMITKRALDQMLQTFAQQPFRLVPYFDEGIWGGQWMEEVCDLSKKENNYAWCFDGVPEENSIRGIVNGITVELPAMDLVKMKPMDVLGPKVFSRFGAEFPIRFDFLDTMGGGNLSLQVHPLTEYIHENFGMSHTQDESYYILDAHADACVYLGVKDGVREEHLIPALQRAAKGMEQFDDTKYINRYAIKKHDHVLIPAGTIHCAGSGAMVLEISATPYIFTMKLWDWGRVGLDGLPRPINVERGATSIQYDRTTAWCQKELLENVQVLQEDAHVKIERTGLHALEFIETRRYWFDEKLIIACDDSVNMLNLIEGEEACITSLDGSFNPFIVHYAETFIVPECVKQYAIEPHGISIGKRLAMIKASVRV